MSQTITSDNNHQQTHNPIENRERSSKKIHPQQTNTRADMISITGYNVEIGCGQGAQRPRWYNHDHKGIKGYQRNIVGHGGHSERPIRKPRRLSQETPSGNLCKITDHNDPNINPNTLHPTSHHIIHTIRKNKRSLSATIQNTMIVSSLNQQKIPFHQEKGSLPSRHHKNIIHTMN